MRCNPNIKPRLWNIRPAEVAYNASRMGLPIKNLRALWWMPEGAGSKTYDYSGNNIDGTINGATWIGNALNFVAASSQYVQTTNLHSTKKTIIARFKTSTDFSGSSSIYGDDQGGIIRFEAADKIVAYAKDAGWRSVTSLSTLNDNKWHTAVFVIDSGTNLELFIDNVSQGTTAFGPLSDGIANAKIGANYAGNDTAIQFFDGQIDYVAVFHAALTPAQVQTLTTDPYGLVRPIPWWEWAYVEAVGGVAPTSIFQGPFVGPFGGPIHV